MAGKMVVIYQTPKDKTAFDLHYRQVHIPLAKKLPGLIKYEISRGETLVSPTAHASVYLVAILYFDSLEAMKTSFATPTGQACAADRRILAPDNDLVQMYLYETEDV